VSYAEFCHLDGAFAGQVRIVRKEFATIGRHPSADVVFDAERDLDVSGRHAAVFREGDRWVVRDLGSSNGTWVNGVRIKGDRPLEPNDVLRFGAAGPQLSFVPREGEPAAIPPTRRKAIPRAPGGAPPPPPGPTTARIRAEVRRQTAGARWVAVGALAAALVATAALGGFILVRNRTMARERAALLARTDTLITRIEATTTTVQGLRAELATARGETEELRGAIAAKEMTVARLDSLDRRLTASVTRHQAALRAARFDAQAVGRDNRDAVGVVLSEFADGRRFAGTGFSIRIRGDTGWILTCRHLITDSAGRPATRLGVIFNGSNQNFRAQLVAAADSADLAILSVQVRGGVPFVRGIAAQVRPGDPVAVFGFPFGFDSPPGPDWRRLGVVATSSPGTIRSATAGLMEVDGYGAAGSSGSPVFDAAGEVVGVVFGGERNSGGRTLYAVPAPVVSALLRRAGADSGSR
jgi:S1-C subfamily serine protease